MKVIAVLSLLIAVASAADLTHKDCGSTAGVTRVWSDDCADPVCKLKKGLFLVGGKHNTQRVLSAIKNVRKF